MNNLRPVLSAGDPQNKTTGARTRCVIGWEEAAVASSEANQLYAALNEIRSVCERYKHARNSALSQIDQIARKALA